MAESSLKRVKNTVGKGEIACYEQFLLFPQCFQKTCTADTLKPGLVRERVNSLPSIKILDLSKKKKKKDKKHWETEKLLVTSNFSFSHSVFKRLVLQTRKNQGLFGKGLTHYQTTKCYTGAN